MNKSKQTYYRAAAALILLAAGVLIVVLAARSRLSRQPANPLPARGRHLSAVPPHHTAAPGAFTYDERKFLLQLARKTIQQVVTSESMPEIDAAGLSSKLTERKGCFVTLTENSELRGCIGHIFPHEPLYLAVMDNARASATRDFRFPPVQPQELDKIKIEISVLTLPQPLHFESPDDLLAKLRPHQDGVVLTIPPSYQATFLPQVWDQLPDKETFMAHLSAKAGLPPWAWKKPGTTVLIYHVEAFDESQM